jgi:hypothetical protein
MLIGRRLPHGTQARRECTGCGKKVPFVLIKEEWFPLYVEPETEERDILLA